MIGEGAAPRPSSSFAARVGAFYRQSVVRNASFLLASNVVTSLLGFVFWVAVARLFSKTDVGVATVVITAAMFIVSIGLVGLDAAITRFLSSAEQPQDQLDTTVTIVTVTTLLAGVVYVLLAPVLSSQLAFLRHDANDAVAFLLLSVGLGVNAILQNAFVARRRAHFVLVSTSVFGLTRIVLLPAVVGLGVLGILGASGSAVLLVCLLNAVVLGRLFHLLPRPRLRLDSLRRVRAYASTLYAASLESSLVVAAIPLAVLNHLGAAQAANYYIVVNLATLLAVIASSAGQSLLAEGAHSMEEFHLKVRTAVAHIFMVLLPLMVVYLLAGPYVLSIFGRSYAAGGTDLLRLLTIASPFVALNYVADSIANVRQRNRLFLSMNTLNAGLILVLSLLLVDHGLTGLGYAWLLAQVATIVVYLVVLRRDLRGFVFSSVATER